MVTFYEKSKEEILEQWCYCAQYVGGMAGRFMPYMCTHSGICVVSTVTICTYLPSVYVSSGNACELQAINYAYDCLYPWSRTRSNPCTLLSVIQSLNTKASHTQASVSELLIMPHVTST
jgi:hypothetical protein